MRTLALALATATLAGCNAQDRQCMARNELGTIVAIEPHETPARYGTIRTSTVRFHMLRYQPTRGTLRVCEANTDDALGMIHVGDTINPRRMTDVTP
jgi:hypothetical protein